MKKILSSNILKLIACISMVFDHIGKISYIFFPNETMYWINYSFSIIGRLALPIFIFLLIEGFYHTSNIKKYFLRLGIIAIIIYLGELIIGLIPSLSLTETIFKTGNIFIDLILILLTLFLFNQKEIKLKVLSVLPVLYFIICLLFQNGTIYISNNILKAFLSGLMSQYSFISPLLIILFIIVHYLYNYLVHKKYSEEALASIDIVTYKKDIRVNSFIISITIISLLSYLLTYLVNDSSFLNTDSIINTYFILSIFVIYFYNGKLGYTNKYIKNAYYLFYPLHIGIIFILTYLVSLI